ncbi:MAG TPA: PilZ domain-containing protein [Myxococcota bacterium]|nr:PilZ domain-containing protein [Myxococcota bacterium]
MPQRRRHRRIKRRFPCELHLGDRRYRGIAIELSESGIFVQTDALIRPRSEIEVHLAGVGSVPSMVLLARVVRRHEVPPELARLVRRGIALDLLEAPVEYGLACGSEPLAAPIDVRRTG